MLQWAGEEAESGLAVCRQFTLRAFSQLAAARGRGEKALFCACVVLNCLLGQPEKTVMAVITRGNPRLSNPLPPLSKHGLVDEQAERSRKLSVWPSTTAPVSHVAP